MNKRYSCLFIVFLMLVSFGMVYGQDKAATHTADEKKEAVAGEPKAEVEKKEEPKKEDVKKIELTMPLGLSGLMYLELKVDTWKKGKEATTFALTRAYLSYERTIWGPVSVKITSDVGTGSKSDGEDNAGDSVEVAGQVYEFFIKNAYLQVAYDWDFLGLKAQGGIIGTPSIGVVGKMQDLRWVYNDYSFDKPGDVGVVGKDTSADVGVSLNTRIFKYVELNYALCHGEGYKHPVETYDGKSHYGTISIMPLKVFYINGFINYEKTDAHTAYFYYGGGLALVADFLKVGGNYIIHGNKVSDNSAQTYHLLEAWIHFNLGPLVPKAPVLIIGRGAYGFKTSHYGDATMLLAGGVGYQFNKYFRVLAYYESYKPIHSAGHAAFYIKTEAKF